MTQLDSAKAYENLVRLYAKQKGYSVKRVVVKGGKNEKGNRVSQCDISCHRGVYVGFRGSGIRIGIGIVSSRDCRIGGGRVAIRVEPTTKITRYLKNSEKPQPIHNKTTLNSEFDEILGKEQERIEKKRTTKFRSE